MPVDRVANSATRSRWPALPEQTNAPLRPVRLQIGVSAAAFTALEPRLHGQELRRLIGTVRRKLVEREHALMAVKRGQAPRRYAIDPVAPVMCDVGERSGIDAGWETVHGRQSSRVSYHPIGYFGWRGPFA